MRAPLLSSINSDESLDQNNDSTGYKFIAGFLAYGSELGNIPNGYFNVLATVQIITAAMTEITANDDLSFPAKLAAYVAVGFYTFQTLVNDLLLIIPAENYEIIYKRLTQKNSQDENRPSRSLFNKLVRGIFFTIIYTAYIILSANGAAGSIGLFYIPILKKTLGIAVGAISTVLGISYAHFYYNEVVMETLHFFKKSFLSPLTTCGIIFRNPVVSLQVIKHFTTVSCFYTTMYTFYLATLTENISELFESSLDKKTLVYLMKGSIGLMFFTNIFIRFMPLKKQYFHDEKSTEKKSPGYCSDILLESSIGFSTMIFLSRYTNNSFLVILPGVSYLGVGVLSLKYKANVITKQKIPLSAKIINFNARIHKSLILLMAAIYKLQNLFKDYADIDFNLDFSQIFCLTIIFGGPIGINKSAMDTDKLAKHLNYLSAKYQMQSFGFFSSLFHSSKDYPLEEKLVLDKILNP